MKIIGLTGGIASGKSTVSDFLAQKGYSIIDGDKVARKVVKPGTKGLSQIIKKFGKDILLDNGQLNRKKLGKIVFNDEIKLKELNEILGKQIRNEIMQQIEKTRKNNIKVVILDIPLLIEGNYDRICDFVMVVSVSQKTQLKRLMQRDSLNEIEAKKRIFAQLSNEERNKKADLLIDNTGLVEDTYEQVIKWLKKNDLILKEKR